MNLDRILKDALLPDVPNYGPAPVRSPPLRSRLPFALRTRRGRARRLPLWGAVCGDRGPMLTPTPRVCPSLVGAHPPQTGEALPDDLTVPRNLRSEEQQAEAAEAARFRANHGLHVGSMHLGFYEW